MLSISEILVCIFNQLDCPSCAAVARVCRTWVDVALDVLWEDLESLFPIMGLLGPIELYGRRFEGYGNKWVNNSRFSNAFFSNEHRRSLGLADWISRRRLGPLCIVHEEG